MGDGNLRPPPPTESTPIDRSPKSCYRWLHQRTLRATAVPNLVQIRPGVGASGQMGSLQYNEILFIYLFIPFFRELTYRSDPSTDFYAWWLKRRGLTQGCAFWGVRRYCSPFWGLNELKSYKKNPILGAWIGVFKPNGRNIKSFILSKLLYRFHPNFCTIWNFQYFAPLAWKRLIMW